MYLSLTHTLCSNTFFIVLVKPFKEYVVIKVLNKNILTTILILKLKKVLTF